MLISADSRTQGHQELPQLKAEYLNVFKKKKERKKSLFIQKIFLEQLFWPWPYTCPGVTGPARQTGLLELIVGWHSGWDETVFVELGLSQKLLQLSPSVKWKE